MIQGQKIEIDVGSDDELSDHPTPAILPSSFVRDVLERESFAPKPPSAPSVKSKSGFPEHRKRDLPSRFKRQHRDTSSTGPKPAENSSSHSEPDRPLPTPATTSSSGSITGDKQKSWEEEEKKRIDQENRQKLAQMSPEEIEEERRELMNSFSPGLLQRILQRSNIESGSNEVDLSSSAHDSTSNILVPEEPRVKKDTKTVRFEESDSKVATQTKEDPKVPSTSDLSHDDVHFPRPPQPPDLDFTSESFFSDLHEKYFPFLPLEPDKLEWMQSSTPSKLSYDSSATAFNASEIRFSFKGELIPPRTAGEIPVTAGLHHHGDAPDAAGYTIAELAHLARSTYPAQRCIAFQTLGRILYRLSKGEFGDPGEPGQDLPGAEDTFGELARGLWREVERTRVVQTLTVESEGNGVDGGRHVSAKAYATEAIWLWQRGGGRRWKAG